MKHNIQWLIENEVIILFFEGELQPDDLRSALTELTNFIDQSSGGKLHVITDMRQVTRPLTMQDSMKVAREFPVHERIAWQITVGKIDIVTKMSIAVVRSVLQTKVISFNTMDEAVAHLKEKVEALSWNSAEMNLLE